MVKEIGEIRRDDMNDFSTHIIMELEIVGCVCIGIDRHKNPHVVTHEDIYYLHGISA